MNGSASRISIDDALSIGADELVETFIRASGPGGQNVNKVATAVQLRFDVAASPSLPDAVKLRLRRLAGRRMTDAGVVVITARRHRTLVRNRADARAILIDLIGKAAVVPKIRRATRPSAGARAARMDDKQHRARIKRQRTVTSSQD